MVAAQDAGRFARAGTRHRFTARRGIVESVTLAAPVMLRVRVSGADFADFPATGPTDHMRVFFPDPATGEYRAPVAAGPGEDGIVRPDDPTFARDFTPLRVLRTDDAVAIEFDVYTHPSPGPAAVWAAGAAAGDELVVVGPRGSRAAPQGAGRVLVVADETARPAAARFASDVPATTAVEVIAATADDGAWVADYLADASGRAGILVRPVAVGPDPGDALVQALTAAGVDDGTYVFAAGEASALLPVRRHLLAALALPREQFSVSGYWRRGTAGFDHHTPVDPDDPD